MHPTIRPVLGLLAAGALIVGATVPALAADSPKGNNGTVKVSDVEMDSIPDNSPHQGCTFFVQFYGFDAQPAEAVATFSLLLPGGGDLWLKDESNIQIGGDGTGAGTVGGFDAARLVNLDGLLEQDALDAASSPTQGLHIRLTVHAPGSIGADTKSKVFWVSGCLPYEQQPT